MKNIFLFMIVLILAVPIVFADDYTDWSRPYIQTKVYSKATGDSYTDNSYLLRSVDNNTGIDYASPSWGSCSVTLGGSVYSGVPLTYYHYNSTYEHYSMIVLYSDRIKQYYANCTLADEYTFSGTAISQLAVINKGYTSGGVTNLPYFAFAYNKSSEVYFQILTLDPETSELMFVEEIDSGDNISTWGGYDKTWGMVGGFLEADVNQAPPEDMWFGAYSKNSDKFFMISDLDDDGDFDKVSIAGATTYDDNSSAHTSLWFDDWNADGYNEFIMVVLRPPFNGDLDTMFELVLIEPAGIAPYYVLTSDTINVDSFGSTGSITTANMRYKGLDGYASICQIGDSDSVLEMCIALYGVESSDPTDEIHVNALIENDFDNFISENAVVVNDGSFEYQKLPFTMKYGGTNIICIEKNTASRPYGCINETGDQIGYFVPINEGAGTASNYIEVLRANIDEDSDTTEILYSNGEVENITWSGTNIALTDWSATFDDTYHGRIYAQDITGDDTEELIYLDATYLKIYSMNSTPPTFLNSTYEGEGDHDETGDIIESSIIYHFYDVSTNLLINDTNVTVTTLGLNTVYYVNTTENGTITINNLPADDYSLSAEATGYSYSHYSTHLSDYQVLNLTMYLLPSNMTSAGNVTISVRDKLSTEPISNATIDVYRRVFFGLTWTKIASYKTDILGKMNMLYQQNKAYKFIVSYDDYTTEEVIIDPIEQALYVIYLESELNGDGNNFIKYTNMKFYNAQSHNFSAQFISTEGEFDNYTLNLTFPGVSGGYDLYSGSNSHGSTLTAEVNISGAVLYDKIYIDMAYNIDGVITHKRITDYILITPGNYTIDKNRVDSSGLGIFEKVLISTMIIFTVAGIGMVSIGTIGAGALGLLTMGFLGYVGFLPMGITIGLVVLVGFVLISWRSSQ